MFPMTGEQVLTMSVFTSMSLSFDVSDGSGDCLARAKRKYHVAVAGRGMQMVEFSPPEDD